MLDLHQQTLNTKKNIEANQHKQCKEFTTMFRKLLALLILATAFNSSAMHSNLVRSIATKLHVQPFLPGAHLPSTYAQAYTSSPSKGEKLEAMIQQFEKLNTEIDIYQNIELSNRTQKSLRWFSGLIPCAGALPLSYSHPVWQSVEVGAMILCTQNTLTHKVTPEVKKLIKLHNAHEKVLKQLDNVMKEIPEATSPSAYTPNASKKEEQEALIKQFAELIAEINTYQNMQLNNKKRVTGGLQQFCHAHLQLFGIIPIL
jgi:hypothetical protein